MTLKRKATATPNPQNIPIFVKILDVGPIREADLELAPLTVLIGPSGSGKSYAAAIIDSLASAPLNALAQARDMQPRGPVADKLARAQELLAEALPIEVARAAMFGRPRGADKKAWADWITKLYTAAGSHCTETAAWLMQECWPDLANRTPPELPLRAGGHVPMVICSHTPSRPSADAAPGVNFAASVFAPEREGELLSAAEAARVAATFAELPEAERKTFDPRRALCIALMNTAFNNARAQFGNQNVLLPAGRAGLWLARRLALSGMANLADRGVPRPVREFYLTLLQLRPRSPGPLEVVAGEIEHHLHRGQLEAVEGRSAVPEIRFRDSAIDVGIDQASSSIVELAALTLWLRYFLSPGDLVIVEEPEAHLHPSKQLLLAECLARLVRSGLRVVITTHSDLLLRKLGSIAMATELADRAEPQRKLGPWQLRHDELAVYRFGADPRGGFIANRETISLGYGIETEELSAVEEALYDERTVLRQKLGNLGSAED